MLGADAAVRARHQREQVRGDRRGGGQLPPAATGRAGESIPDHGPAGGRRDRRGGDRLQVRLVEGGEDTLGVVQPAVQREVRLAVRGVDETVQARAGARVPHVRLDPQFVDRPQAGQRQPVPGQRGRIHVLPVEYHPAQPGRADLDEAARARRAAAEPDDGDRAEHVIAAGDVELDAVPENVDEPGALLRFGVRQVSQESS